MNDALGIGQAASKAQATLAEAIESFQQAMGPEPNYEVAATIERAGR